MEQWRFDVDSPHENALQNKKVLGCVNRITLYLMLKGRYKEMSEKLKVVAVLEVNMDRLVELKSSIEHEMGWLEQSGIRMVECQEQSKEYEYASFLWNRKHCRYEQVNRAVQTEQLCRNRLQEYISKGWLSKDYDTDKVVIKRRTMTVIVSEWGELNERN